MNENQAKIPVHLWIVGVLALLWNFGGVFDYSATKLQLDFYMSQFTAEQLEYFYAFPSWMVAAWAVAVWGSFIGSLGLLLRKAWAVLLFGAALLGLAVSTLYNFVLSNGMEVMGEAAAGFTAAIWVIAIFLFLYARAMARRGVLR